MWGDLGQVGWEWEKLSWELILTSQSRLRAAGRAGIFDLCTFHNYGSTTTITSLPLLFSYNLDLQVDLTCHSFSEQQSPQNLYSNNLCGTVHDGGNVEEHQNLS